MIRLYPVDQDKQLYACFSLFPSDNFNNKRVGKKSQPLPSPPPPPPPPTHPPTPPAIRNWRVSIKKANITWDFGERNDVISRNFLYIVASVIFPKLSAC